MKNWHFCKNYHNKTMLWTNLNTEFYVIYKTKWFQKDLKYSFHVANALNIVYVDTFRVKTSYVLIFPYCHCMQSHFSCNNMCIRSQKVFPRPHINDSDRRRQCRSGNTLFLLFMSSVDRIFQCSIATRKQFLNLRLKGNV